MTIPFESYRAITAGGSSPFDPGEGRALTRRSFPTSQRGEDCVRPSVRAAGPGCRISADLISTMWSFRTAGIASQPGRCRILSGTTFLPHQEARMTSGAATITSCGETIRSLAAFCRTNRLFLTNMSMSSPAFTSDKHATIGDTIAPVSALSDRLPDGGDGRNALPSR